MEKSSKIKAFPGKRDKAACPEAPGASGGRRKPSMEEKRLQRLERHSRLYHWAGSVGKWLQEQNHGDVVYLSNGNGAVTFPRPSW